MSADEELGKDLVQEALIKAYLHWDRICDLDAPDAYVRKIIVNEHASLRRTSWRRRELTNSPFVEAAADTEADPPSSTPTSGPRS